jgi:hypothetical protein
VVEVGVEGGAEDDSKTFISNKFKKKVLSKRSLRLEEPFRYQMSQEESNMLKNNPNHWSLKLRNLGRFLLRCQNLKLSTSDRLTFYRSNARKAR